MLFNSYAFIVLFLPVALLGFFACALVRDRLAASWLVGVSLLFYAWWNVSFLPLLLASIVINYGMSELIDRARERPATQSALLSLAIAINLATLFYFKYLFEVVQFLLGRGIATIHMDPVILPLGISFFTFTQIGYLIDVKQGAAARRGALNYALFVTFFPHLIAGPILHHREMMPQFAEPSTYRFSRRNFAIGLTVFIFGLFKKTILADPLSQAVAHGFSDPAGLGLVDSWRTIATYSLQLYFDFSGYSDMAIGLAYMFNIRFPLNFDSPFKAESVIEYWQRWHMTLTRYLNLYLYNPLALWVTRWRAKNGLGTTRTAHRTVSGFISMSAFPTFVTMGLIGLWHGAGAQFVIFGLIHGVYITWNNVWRLSASKTPALKKPPVMRAVIRARNIALTYVAVLVALVFFRARSVGDAAVFISGMMGANGVGVRQPVGAAALIWLAGLYVIVWALPNVHQIMGAAAPALGKSQAAPGNAWLIWTENWPWALGVGVLLALSFLGIGGSSEFLYFQF